MTTTAANNEVTIFGRIIRPERDDLSPEAAQALLQLDFDDADKARMDELAAKARQGAQGSGEQEELQSYLHVGHLLALLQSKARASLKHHTRREGRE